MVQMIKYVFRKLFDSYLHLTKLFTKILLAVVFILIFNNEIDQIEKDADEVVGEMHFRQSVSAEKKRGCVESADFNGNDALFQAKGNRFPNSG